GRVLPRSRASTVVVLWFAAVGLVFLPVAFLHEDCWPTTVLRCWERQQAGELSWQHYAHVNSSAAFGLFVCLSPVMLWLALPRGTLRMACGACAVLGVAALVAGMMFSHPASPAASHDRGLAERVEAVLVNAWVIGVMAAALIANLISSARRPGTPLPAS
ncbi:MAG: hypothetical protein QOI80_3118, partial [Solirubrobacteraceae bacterium]|nr:hypothetical protein [Solirubrobacteraceae bacterium]